MGPPSHPSAPIPKNAYPVLALMLALMAFAAWNQSYWWITLEEDHFGWLTPAFALFVLYDRLARLIAAWNEAGAAGSIRASGFSGIFLNVLAAGAFLVGLLALVAGAIDRAGGGHSFKGTFIASFGGSLLLLAVPWLTAPSPQSPTAGSIRSDLQRVRDNARHPPPQSPTAGKIRADPRVALCGLLLFPAVVWLFSEPLLTQVETELSSHILGPMAAIVAQIFDLLGSPISREGNILLMPDHGRVGIEEACSGIRSFAACLYAGTFLGALMLKRFWQQALLIVLATFIALILNFARSLFLTTWAYNHGTASIEGFVHDSAGYLVMGLTVAALFLILSCLTRDSHRPRWDSAA